MYSWLISVYCPSGGYLPLKIWFTFIVKKWEACSVFTMQYLGHTVHSEELSLSTTTQFPDSTSMVSVSFKEWSTYLTSSLGMVGEEWDVTGNHFFMFWKWIRVFQILFSSLSPGMDMRIQAFFALCWCPIYCGQASCLLYSHLPRFPLHVICTGQLSISWNHLWNNLSAEQWHWGHERRVGQFLKQTPPRCWFIKNKNWHLYFSIFFVSKTGKQGNFLVRFEVS